MKFKINEEVIKDFPNLRIGVVVAKNIDNRGSDQEIIKSLRDAEKEVANLFPEGTPVSSHETISAWRKAYKLFGAKDMTSSVESLAKRASKGKTLPDINKAVNLYNLISLKYLLPLGGENIDKMEGNLVLRKATGKEEFIPLLETENNPPKEGEVIYADDKSVICRAWNWREADKTKLTEETKNAVFVIESLLENERDRLERAAKELSELLLKHCPATCRIEYLDESHREVVIG